MPRSETTRDDMIHRALLLLRIGFGIMFIMHGAPKLFGGIEEWNSLGSAMQYVGIPFGYTFWGFCAALSEFGGAILLLTGFGARIAAAFMCITTSVAAVMHLAQGSGIMGASHAIESSIVFLTFIIAGPGRYSVQQFLFTLNTGDRP